MGGTLAPTAAPGGIAGTGIGLAHVGAAPPPPPEANLAYKKSGGAGPFVLVPGPSREKHLPDSWEGLPDSREGGYSNFISLSKQKPYHFRSKNHIVVEAKTISFSKQKRYHFRSKNHIIFEAKPYQLRSKIISFS